MLQEKIKYVDFDGVEREETFLFNLTKAELSEWELSMDGGLSAYLQKIVNTKSAPELSKMFKEVILKAYGEKSADGKRFIKTANDGHKLADDFAQTEAYSELFMSLLTDADKASAFIKGIIPADLSNAKTSIPATTK